MTLAVTEGVSVRAGDAVGTIEAMKREAAITAPRAGIVVRVATAKVQQVGGGDLLVELGESR